ncbi:MAG: hypothetical protein V4677_09240 [Bacteroidota bacterium]
MGRLVIPIGIDINRVNAVFGSHDEVLFDQLVRSRYFKKFDEEFSFKRELSDLIFTYVPVGNRKVVSSKLFGLIKGTDGRRLEGEWNDYGYALLTMCSYLGYTFSETNDELEYSHSWEQINTLLRINGCRMDLSRMLESKQVFDTPYIHDDIYTNIYSKKEVVELVSHLLIIEKDIEEKNQKPFYVLKSGLLNCMDKHLDLVIFSYEI